MTTTTNTLAIFEKIEALADIHKGYCSHCGKFHMTKVISKNAKTTSTFCNACGTEYTYNNRVFK